CSRSHLHPRRFRSRAAGGLDHPGSLRGLARGLRRMPAAHRGPPRTRHARDPPSAPRAGGRGEETLNPSRTPMSLQPSKYIWKNGLTAAYIRPIVYLGYENLGVNPIGNPVDVAVAAYPWGKYLGPEALDKGVAVCVSSWRRAAPDTYPAMAKAGGHYMNSQL